ncbi:hypothetical protein ACROYT_G035278 [Oculina patagonica]
MRPPSFRIAINVLCSQLRSLYDNGVTVRVDPAPGFSAFSQRQSTSLLWEITIVVGTTKNPNKNTKIERATEKLGIKLLHLSPEGAPVPQIMLSLAMANMNSRSRRDGLSAIELGTQCDQWVNGLQLLFLPSSYSAFLAGSSKPPPSSIPKDVVLTPSPTEDQDLPPISEDILSTTGPPEAPLDLSVANVTPPAPSAAKPTGKSYRTQKALFWQ